ncbi:MAG: penicillin acylase family protein [Propionibacteriaceae bacterium]
MRPVPRSILFTAFVVILVVGALSSLAVVTVRDSFPQTRDKLSLSVLTQPVDVLRDGYGIPHIYADNAEDLFAAQGFVHAQDRFFEMDVRRHITSGRLAELFGEEQVATDAYVRTLGWRQVAEAELRLLSPSTRRYLDAYASGVNAYLNSRSNTSDMALEYTLLDLIGPDYTPEEWSAVDSIAWLKAMAWDLGSNRTQEVERTVMTDLVGAGRTADLFPEYDLAANEPIVDRGRVVDGAFDPKARGGSERSAWGLDGTAEEEALSALRNAAKADDAIPDLVGDSASLGAGIGSNSWVVSGAKTSTGLPILSNDPHLATSIPSVFSQVGLHCREVSERCPFDVSGFSFSGMPGVIIGHNQQITWGLTTSYPDVQDYYLEEVREDTVRVGDAYEPLEVRTESIKVAGEDEPVELTIRSSRHGPLMSDVDDQLARMGREDHVPEEDRQADTKEYAVALQWVALTPNRTMDALFGFNEATDFTEFREAAKHMAAPSQNLIYADVEGNIGYQLPGDIPARGKGNGLRPAPGWDTDYDWQGMIPFEELPWMYNPPNDYIVTANNPIIGDQYQHHLGSEYAYGWRSQQLVDRLDRPGKISPAAADELFYDTTIRAASKITPALLKVRVADSWVAEGQQTLVGWDYTSDADSAPAAYFNVVFKNILEHTFQDEMPEELWPSGGGRWYAVVAHLLDKPDSLWWDDVTTEEVETRDDILLAAMTEARKEITSAMSRDTGGWEWGKLHRLTLEHQTLGQSGIAPVEALFNRGDHQLGGGGGIVNALAWDASQPGYRIHAGPTMRMLVDLSDLDNSRWVNQTGVSGHPFHKHYDDQTALWANNELFEFVSSPARVEARTVDRLRLEPGG